MAYGMPLFSDQRLARSLLSDLRVGYLFVYQTHPSGNSLMGKIEAVHCPQAMEVVDRG